MTLGPAAGPALEALDAMADGPLDDHARDQARAASTAIREALLITRDGAPEPAQAEASARQQIMRLLHAAQAEQSRDNRDVLVAELIGLIKHPDAYVRAGAADGLAILTLGPSEIAAATPVLQRMLEDEAFAEVGIAGAFECGGRLFHWRQERRSPRASAIRALFAIGWMPAGDYMLKAMLAEAAFAKVTCGAAAEPQHFTIAQWRMASEAAGGLAIAEPLIRATRQQCRHEFWQGNSRFNVCEAELAEVIRILSGRLLP
jgi:hypothetical protein